MRAKSIYGHIFSLWDDISYTHIGNKESTLFNRDTAQIKIVCLFVFHSVAPVFMKRRVSTQENIARMAERLKKPRNDWLRLTLPWKVPWIEVYARAENITPVWTISTLLNNRTEQISNILSNSRILTAQANKLTSSFTKCINITHQE